MAELRQVLSSNGLQEVQTYIQSGNVIFRCSINSEKKLAGMIENAISKHFGFEVPALVVQPELIAEILDGCPFPLGKKEKSHFTLLFEEPKSESVGEFERLSFENEEFIVHKSWIYFYCSTGYARTKLNNNHIEKILKTKATSRNYRTMMKLLSLCNHNQLDD